MVREMRMLMSVLGPCITRRLTTTGMEGNVWLTLFCNVEEKQNLKTTYQIGLVWGLCSSWKKKLT